MGMVMVLRSIGLGLLGLTLLASCATSPPPAPQPYWIMSSNSDVTHRDSEGKCPAELGVFTRTEMSRLPSVSDVPGDLEDGLCRYEAASVPAYMTVFFYQAHGSQTEAETIAVAKVVVDQRGGRLLEDASTQCERALQTALALKASGGVLDDGDRLTLSGDQRCVMFKTGENVNSLASVEKKGDWFLKTRITAGHATKASRDAIQKAAIELHAAQ